MKKYIVAIAALVALAVPTAAMAAVSYDEASAGSVSKGDVQSLFGWNDAALQTAWKDGKIKFTSKYVMATDTNWSCSDGSIGHWVIASTFAQPLNVTPQTNP
jgi:hypothetical protein